jgi:transposase
MPNPFAYPEELRAEGVRLYRQEGMSFRKVADQLGVTAPTVQDWVRKAESEVEEAALDDKAEIRRLQKELRRTQQERDILKKAVAFFVKESEDR